jgi:hypothetical protein
MELRIMNYEFRISSCTSSMPDKAVVHSKFSAIHSQHFHQQIEVIALVGEIFMSVIGPHVAKVEILDFL